MPVNVDDEVYGRALEVKLFFNANKTNEKCFLVNFRAAFLTAAVIYCLAAGARWHEHDTHT